MTRRIVPHLSAAAKKRLWAIPYHNFIMFCTLHFYTLLDFWRFLTRVIILRLALVYKEEKLIDAN